MAKQSKQSKQSKQPDLFQKTDAKNFGEPVDSPQESWKFNQFGDMFIGEFLETQTVEQENGKDFQLLVFQSSIDSLNYTLSSGQLKKLVADQKIVSREIYLITYLKDVDTGFPSKMKAFSVVKVAPDKLEAALAYVKQYHPEYWNILPF